MLEQIQAHDGTLTQKALVIGRGKQTIQNPDKPTSLTLHGMETMKRTTHFGSAKAGKKDECKRWRNEPMNMDTMSVCEGGREEKRRNATAKIE